MRKGSMNCRSIPRSLTRGGDRKRAGGKGPRAEVGKERAKCLLKRSVVGSNSKKHRTVGGPRTGKKKFTAQHQSKTRDAVKEGKSSN